MKPAFRKRLEAIEQRQLRYDASLNVTTTSDLPPITETARRIAFVLSLGILAKQELAEAGDSLKPRRRDQLNETLDQAERIAWLLAKNGRPDALETQLLTEGSPT